MIVGFTDLADVSVRPVQLIAGRTWTGSAFGGERNMTTTSKKSLVLNSRGFMFGNSLDSCILDKLLWSHLVYFVAQALRGGLMCLRWLQPTWTRR